MRKEYGKVLRQYFTRQMREKLPEFGEEKVSSGCFWPGQRAFCRPAAGLLKCWIVLSPSPKGDDEFTVLIGWSTLGRYPELTMVPSPQRPSPDRAEFALPEYLVRLPQLWTTEDLWWVVEEFVPALSVQQMLAKMASLAAAEAEKRVVPRVDEAIAAVREHGLPYLDLLVRSRGAG